MYRWYVEIKVSRYQSKMNPIQQDGLEGLDMNLYDFTTLDARGITGEPEYQRLRKCSSVMNPDSQPDSWAKGSPVDVRFDMAATLQTGPNSGQLGHECP